MFPWLSDCAIYPLTDNAAALTSTIKFESFPGEPKIEIIPLAPITLPAFNISKTLPDDTMQITSFEKAYFRREQLNNDFFRFSCIPSSSYAEDMFIQHTDGSFVFNLRTIKFFVKANNNTAIGLNSIPYEPIDSVVITKEFVECALAAAESLPTKRRYLPPHFKRDEYILKLVSSANSAEKPFKAIEDELNSLPVRVVVCAANRVAQGENHVGLIIPGPRHHSPTMCAIYGALGIVGIRDDQGFIDQWGQFLTREEAMAVVKHSGQPFDVKRNGIGDDPKELYSEGIC